MKKMIKKSESKAKKKMLKIKNSWNMQSFSAFFIVTTTTTAGGCQVFVVVGTGFSWFFFLLLFLSILAKYKYRLRGRVVREWFLEEFEIINFEFKN